MLGWLTITEEIAVGDDLAALAIAALAMASVIVLIAVLSLQAPSRN